MADTKYLQRAGRNNLAYAYTEPDEEGKNLPTVMFCGGYASDMQGTKALYLEQQCKERGQGFVRFDYGGHGLSGGEFKDGTIGSWKDDSLAIMDHIDAEQFIVIGSSMGGWIALLIAGERTDKISGLIGIAAAPDFTRDIKDGLTRDQKDAMENLGYIEEPNDYSDEPYIFTKALLEDGEKRCLLDQEHTFPFPVRLLHGMEDTDVPWQVAFRIKNSIIDGDVDVTLVETAGHSMSRDEDLALIDTRVREISDIEESPVNSVKSAGHNPK